MWKKDEEQPTRATPVAAASTETVRAPVSRSGHATIGPSIVIKGEVSGNEDLLIQGQIDGSVALETHSVTVGGGGRVKANISGRVITVEGDVQGDLSAHEQIVLRGSAKVQGDLKAPRVVLEDGASFRGLVDMGPPATKEPKEGKRPVEGGARTPAGEAAATTRVASASSAAKGTREAADGRAHP